MELHELEVAHDRPRAQGRGDPVAGGPGDVRALAEDLRVPAAREDDRAGPHRTQPLGREDQGARRQQPASSVSRSTRNVLGQRSIDGCAWAASRSVSRISAPVASPRAWSTHGSECPPSRASAGEPGSPSNFAPSAMRSRMRRAPPSTTERMIGGIAEPLARRPSVSPSRWASSMRKPRSAPVRWITVATPPWAQPVLEASSCPSRGRARGLRATRPRGLRSSRRRRPRPPARRSGGAAGGACRTGRSSPARAVGASRAAGSGEQGFDVAGQAARGRPSGFGRVVNAGRGR